MGNVNFRKVIFSSSLLLGLHQGFSQPFVDIINTSFQSLTTTYQDSLKSPNTTNNYYLNITIPIRLDSQNTLIARFYGENLITHRDDPAIDVAHRKSNLYSALLPIGWQHETANKKWKYLALAMPKVSSDFKDNFNASYDFQMGGYAMATYARSQDLKIKFGLFYNQEAFGPFPIPLAAIDWKVCKWFQMYGILPNNYRFEFALWQKKLYAGLGFKSYTRSYRLSSAYGHDYVRNNEMQLKLFVDMYFAKKFVLFGEFGRTIGYSPLVYKYGTKERSLSAPQYFPIKDAFFFNVGIAYRIRFDF